MRSENGQNMLVRLPDYKYGSYTTKLKSGFDVIVYALNVDMSPVLYEDGLDLVNMINGRLT